jgi:hypothetical protein
MRAGRAPNVQCLTLRDLQAHSGRRLIDLSSLAQRHFGTFRSRPALRAVARAMLHYLIRQPHQAQGLATMPPLPTWLLLALRPQALGVAMAVLGQRSISCYPGAKILNPISI